MEYNIKLLCLPKTRGSFCMIISLIDIDTKIFTDFSAMLEAYIDIIDSV